MTAYPVWDSTAGTSSSRLPALIYSVHVRTRKLRTSETPLTSHYAIILQPKLLFADKDRFRSDRVVETWGDQLRRRAKGLGLMDVEVARRLGIAQGR